jgi:hypothetical protein
VDSGGGERGDDRPGRGDVAVANTTWNPADKSANITLSNGNLSISTTTTVDSGVRSTTSITTGAKVYFEITWFITSSGADTSCGIATSAAVLGSMGSTTLGGLFVYPAGSVYFNGASQPFAIPAPGSGGIYCLAIDLVNSRAWVRLNNGNWNNSGTANPTTNVGGVDISGLFPANAAFVAMTTQQVLSPLATVNFGASSFSYTVPSGFAAWNFVAVTNALATQAAAEHWLTTNPQEQVTQVAIEHWASLAIVPPVGASYALPASRAGIGSAVLWQTTASTYAVPLSAIVAEATAAPPPPVSGGAQARVMVLA